MEKLIVYCDGGSRGNPGKSASAFVVKKNGQVIKSGSVFLGISTNNVAEYKAVMLALIWILKNPSIKYQVSSITFFLDSELVVRQLAGLYKVKNKKLQSLFMVIKNIEKKLFAKVNYVSVKRKKNILADTLVNQELDKN